MYLTQECYVFRKSRRPSKFRGPEVSHEARFHTEDTQTGATAQKFGRQDDLVPSLCNAGVKGKDKGHPTTGHEGPEGE